MCTLQPRFIARKQQADALEANAYWGIGFCKEQAKTFEQLLLHKFPRPGCDGRVSKFPIQSLQFSMVRTAVLNEMTCAVSKKLQNFRRVLGKFLLFKFRQGEDYSEQSKPYFKPLTFA